MPKKGHWIRPTPVDHKHSWKIVGPSLTRSGVEIVVFTCRHCESYFGMRKKVYYPALLAKRKQSCRVRRTMAIHYTGIPKALNKS